MHKELLIILAFVMLFAATDVGRKKERLQPYSWKWWWQFFLIASASYIFLR